MVCQPLCCVVPKSRALALSSSEFAATACRRCHFWAVPQAVAQGVGGHRGLPPTRGLELLQGCSVHLASGNRLLCLESAPCWSVRRHLVLQGGAREGRGATGPPPWPMRAGEQPSRRWWERGPAPSRERGASTQVTQIAVSTPGQTLGDHVGAPWPAVDGCGAGRFAALQHQASGIRT